jgi:hypothetical protein
MIFMKTIIAVTFVSILCGIVFSQNKNSDEFKPEIKLSAVIYTGWEFNIDNRNFILKLDSSQGNPNEAFGYSPLKNQFEISQNSFYLERAYMTVLASLAPTVKARLTSDVFQIIDGTGKTQYQLGIKFAWLNWTAYKSKSGFALDLVLGVIPNQWIMLNDKYYGYRSFGKTLTDYQWTVSAARSTVAVSGVYTVNRTTSSYFPAADLGANVTLSFPKSYAEVYFNVFDGNGFRNLGFDNRFKDFEVLAFFHPLAEQIKTKSDNALKKSNGRIKGISELTFGGFAYFGKLGFGENSGGAQYKRNRAGGMFNVRYNFNQFGFLKLGGEYAVQLNQDPQSENPLQASDVTATGLSAYAEFNPPVKELYDKLMLVARYDLFDPNTANDGNSSIGFNSSTDKQSLFLTGISYKPYKEIMFGMSYQQTTYEVPFIIDYNGKTHKNDSGFFIHSSLEF